MYSGGFIGTVLRVNLTERSVGVEELPYETARDFVGGAGIGIRYLFDELAPKTVALGPENKLILATGPFTGTDIPCASRMAVVTKSPQTGAVGMALTGGFFPAELKLAGYDVVIVEGRADAPVYLSVRDDTVKIRDASHLWGLNTSDLQWTLKDELHDQNVRIACIGPAGERLSRIACIINERRAAGRKGVGAVMGSKNLKAIAVRGTGVVPIADPTRFKKALTFMRRKMKESPALYPHFAKTGTPAVAELTMAMGILSAKNYAGTGAFVPLEGLGMEAQNQRSVGRNPCYKCPVACSQLKLARKAYEGTMSEGPEFETIYSFGSACGVDDLDAVIAADRLCDDLGLDSMSAGVSIAFAMELYERGILSKDTCDGLDLTWGNHAAMLEVLRKMGSRRGIGDLLADGTRAAAKKIGDGADQYAMHIKGLELPAYDVRGAKAHGLNYATSYTGADHNRGYAFQEIFSIPVPYEVDRLEYEGKGHLCKWNQDVRTVTCDCAPMCAFVLDTALPDVALRNTADLMNAATGIRLTEDEVYAAGERTINVAKAFNVREGFTRADDTLPRRLIEEEIVEGPSKGERIPQDKLDSMLDEYYEARGWNPVSGLPTRERLETLGLSDVADKLQLAKSS